MPIKFRCPHCRQFLGISRAKAGEVADCPMCGKTLRVPNLDGSIRPLPKPELDLEDPDLVDALGELAGIGGDNYSSGPSRSPRSESEQTLPIAAPRAQPVVLEPLEPAVPVAVAAPPQPSVRPAAARPAAPAQAVPPRPSGSPRDAGRGDAEPVVVGRSKSPSPGRTTGRRLPTIVWVALSALAGLVLVGGAGVMLMNRTDPAPTAAEDNSLQTAPVAPAPDGPVTGSPIEREPALTGRITYVSDAGDTRPDDGARVIVFPAERRGTIRFDADGFMVGSGEVDSKVATAALRALGGDLAITDEKGEYAIQLPLAGSYQVVVISRHQSRPWQVGVEASTQEMLERYFLRPSTLLGQLAYDVQPIQYRGQGTSPRDVAFERQ